MKRIIRLQAAVVHRVVALGLAIATTSFIATSVAVVFTGNSPAAGATLVRVAVAPFQILLGTW